MKCGKIVISRRAFASGWHNLNMSKLKVTFEDPRSGGIWIQLHSATQSVEISATYIYNGFFDLVDALYRIYGVPGQVVLGRQQETAVWMCEPSGVEMRFSRQEDAVRLDVIWFPDSSRSQFNQPEPEMSVSGNYDEVCLPFWRALRNLQSRFSASEFEEKWRAPFPTQELARLTKALGK